MTRAHAKIEATVNVISNLSYYKKSVCSDNYFLLTSPPLGNYIFLDKCFEKMIQFHSYLVSMQSPAPVNEIKIWEKEMTQ